MLRDWWNRLMKRDQEATVEREVEREHMSPAEREFDSESVDDIQADRVAEEHLGGFNPEQFEED
jgi:hypothetical protein